MLRRHSRKFPEDPGKVALGRITQVGGDLGQGVVRVAEQILRFLQLLFMNVVPDTGAHLLLELQRKTAGTQAADL